MLSDSQDCDPKLPIIQLSSVHQWYRPSIMNQILDLRSLNSLTGWQHTRTWRSIQDCGTHESMTLARHGTVTGREEWAGSNGALDYSGSAQLTSSCRQGLRRSVRWTCCCQISVDLLMTPGPVNSHKYLTTIVTLFTVRPRLISNICLRCHH